MGVLVERLNYRDSIGWISYPFRDSSVRKRVWSLIGQRTVDRLPTSLIGREAVFGGFRGWSNRRLGSRNWGLRVHVPDRRLTTDTRPTAFAIFSSC